MRKPKPLYEKFFSRDFSLPIFEIWGKVEGSKNKFWTTEAQPFLPYIVFRNIGKTVESYYDPRGVKWIQDTLISRSRKDDDFLKDLEKSASKKIKNLALVYERQRLLSKVELVSFLKDVEAYWPWFEALWWACGSHSQIGTHSASLLKLREQTQDFVPKSDALVRASLAHIFPRLERLSHTLTFKEVVSQKPPSRETLLKRSANYFLVGGALKVDVTTSDIELEQGIAFEQIDVETGLREFKGQVAYKGKVQGVVRVVLSARQIDKVEEGNILVSTMTLPDFLPAIKNAAAIITDEGGIMCHAAITARELEKPCVIGTKIATKLLKDGDIVLVNADTGTVFIKN